MEKETIIAKQQGFSLIEVTFCLLLVTIIALGSFNILGNHLHLKRTIDLDRQNKEKADFFFQLLENYFQQASILHNIQSIKIHPQSKIPDQNNHILSIGKSSNKIKANSAADAISFLILNTEVPLENISINQGPEEQELCLANYFIEKNQKQDLKDYNYFYALYLDSKAEVKGKIKATNKKSEDCLDNFLYNFELINFPRSIFSDKDPAGAPLIIFPIEESFTFYLDNNKTLRRFSILTGENQPLIRGVTSLKITSQKIDTINKITFSLTLEKENQQGIIEFKKEFFTSEKYSSSYYDLVL